MVPCIAMATHGHISGQKGLGRESQAGQVGGMGSIFGQSTQLQPPVGMPLGAGGVPGMGALPPPHTPQVMFGGSAPMAGVLPGLGGHAMAAGFQGQSSATGAGTTATEKMSKSDAIKAARMHPIFRLHDIDVQLNGTSLDSANTIVSFFLGMNEKLMMDALIDGRSQEKLEFYTKYFNWARQEAQKAFKTAVSRCSRWKGIFTSRRRLR